MNNLPDLYYLLGDTPADVLEAIKHLLNAVDPNGDAEGLRVVHLITQSLIDRVLQENAAKRILNT